jgi:hypothetical protein
MMQDKLSGLIGRPSGYIESLPAPVKRRVAGLKGVQKEHSKLEAEFQEEVLQLEKRYFAKFTPLYEKRAKIVNGQSEPTDEEVEAGEAGEEEEGGEEAEKTEAKKEETTSAADTKGIPEFWLSAMKNSSLAETITDRDEEALKHLTDIRMEYLDRPGFRLIFEFAENDFFTNKTISKTYYYQEENGYGGDFIYDRAEGEKISWKSGKDLTVKVESKKQRNKSKWQIGNHTELSVLTSSQTPSRHASSKRRFRHRPFSISSTQPRHQAKTTMRKRWTRSSKQNLSSTISSEKTSRRNSFLVQSTGLLVKPCNSNKVSMSLTRNSKTRTTMMKTKIVRKTTRMKTRTR